MMGLTIDSWSHVGGQERAWYGHGTASALRFVLFVFFILDRLPRGKVQAFAGIEGSVP